MAFYVGPMPKLGIPEPSEPAVGTFPCCAREEASWPRGELLTLLKPQSRFGDNPLKL